MPKLFLFFLSSIMMACGGLHQELESLPASSSDNAQPASGDVTISWNPVFFEGASSTEEASTYRVLYGEPGRRPQEAVSDNTQVALNGVSSIDNYDVLIEGYDSEGNSLFISDYSVL